MTSKGGAIPVRETRLGSLALSYALVRQCVELGRRKIHATAERRRMARVRSHPEDLLRALRRASSILVVCHGNIIRSPFAAALLRAVMAPLAMATIRSAGVDALPGRAPHPTAVRVAGTMHIDLNGHSATPLTQELVAKTDLIFALDILQLVAIRRRFPDARTKTFLLACLSPFVPLEIRDPIDGDEDVFVACYRHIAGAVLPIARVLSDRAARR
jgi:protein-tyrosine-phosphatase